MGHLIDWTAQLFTIGFVSSFVAALAYVAVHGGVFRRKNSSLNTKQKLGLFFVLYLISMMVCAAYALLINLGILDNDISFLERRVPIHFLWAFFLIPTLSFLLGKIWFYCRYESFNVSKSPPSD